jgi:DNA-binding MarR family transcriptional regulator
MISDEEYRRLLTFRTRLREFNAWSQQAAATQGLTHAQHQLLVAVRGHEDPAGPTIGDVATYLLVKHHTASGLADRTERLGLTERTRDEHDQRAVRLRLTDRGAEVLEALSEIHLEELRRLASVLDAL